MATTFNVEIPNISPTLVKRVLRDQLTVGKTYFVIKPQHQPAGTDYDYVGVLIDDPAEPVQPANPSHPRLPRPFPFFGVLYARFHTLLPGANINPWIRLHQRYETAYHLPEFYEVIDPHLAELMDQIHIDNSQWYAVRTWEHRLLPEDALHEYRQRQYSAILSLYRQRVPSPPPVYGPQLPLLPAEGALPERLLPREVKPTHIPQSALQTIMSFAFADRTERAPAGKKSRKRRGKRRLKSRSAKK